MALTSGARLRVDEVTAQIGAGGMGEVSSSGSFSMDNVARVIRDALAAFRGGSFNAGDVISPERLDGIEATGDFFAAHGVAPEIGHFFERANETPGFDHVAVLSDAVWRGRFGADPLVLGRVFTLN
ncbi:MAG TPA: hypothetical protein VHU82_04005, partial [Vicinamibacterales bacterium]|nr:hypothetical protein [Vicinamibacterales bacterium]